MSSYDYLRRSQNGRHSPNPPSPLRHASNASSSSETSSAYSNPSSTYSNPFPVSRTSTISSYASNYTDYSAKPSQKRGIGETSPTRATAGDYQYRSDHLTLPPSSRHDRDRPHLKTLEQAPNVTLTPTPEKMSSRGVRFDESSVEKTPTPASPNSPQSSHTDSAHKRFGSIGVGRSDSRRVKPGQHRGPISPQSSVFEGSDLEKLGSSTTGHLRTLSKFAEQDKSEFSFSSNENQDVSGLQGRRRLQQYTTDKAKRSGTTPGYGGRTWMDTQRQFLQAYEYLCHIGEAKEWIEEVIAKPIPPIVQLEESLRDGVVLAEVVQALQKDKALKIFRNPKLQFRHSDNIAIFFRFVADVQLPELFRFELVDLYDKKNIPKVIYCIHALSWILLQKGMVDFRIGNLVGQLEFEHHELEATQKGLDKSGVSMPNFSGMQKNFGAEPEPPPEPKETEEERIERELYECEDAILELQAQSRGALQRLRLGDVMQDLWDHEDFIIDFQARIRGDFARQISDYHLQMKKFSVGLQSASRGYIVRTKHRRQESFWKSHAEDVVTVQSIVRARKARAQTNELKMAMQRHESGLKSIQAVIRGMLHRRSHGSHVAETKSAEPAVIHLQRHIRGALERMKHRERAHETRKSEDQVIDLQAQVRGLLKRRQLSNISQSLQVNESQIVKLQAAIRASHVQARHQRTMEGVRTAENSSKMTSLQSACRANMIRLQTSRLREDLGKTSPAAILLQSAVRGYICREKASADMDELESHDRRITDFQALCRASRVRTGVYDLLCEFNQYEAEVVELQSALRGISVRSKLGEELEQLEAQEQMIVDLQAEARGVIVRRQFAEKQRHFNANMEKVIKIQSFVRGRQQGKAYESLTSGKNPPVNVVKNFVHLLNDSDFDFDEEVEVEKLRKEVGSRARAIEQQEEYIAELDAKIGLLAANKIARDEISRQVRNHEQSRSNSSSDSLNLKALNKNSRAKLELYQQLFVILQTDPIYFARLFKRYREKGASEDDFRRLESLTISAYGMYQKHREEFHLLRLIAMAMEVEAAGCPSLQDFQRGSFFFNRIFSNYTRAPVDRRFVRDVMGPLIKTTIIENRGLDLESDPLQIYRAIINNEELSTGLQSSRPLDIPREQAIKDPQTREAFIRHLQDLRDLVDQFFSTLEDSLHRFPYGPRHVARQMYDILCQQYQREDPALLLQQVGNWLWKSYLKPALVEPEKSGAADRGLDGPQRRNLSEYVKVINQVASGRMFGDDNVYLQPLNSYVSEAIGRMLDLWAKVIDVEDAESHFDIDVMDDIHAKKPPTLHIKTSDMFALHQIVADNLSSLCIHNDDVDLRDVVRELGSARSNEAEISAGSSDVTLSLSARLHDKPDPESDVKALLMETKRCILFIIRVQAGSDLMDIMLKPISDDDEARWDALVREELAQGLRRSGTRRGHAYTDAGASIISDSNLADLSTLSYPELKSIALENIIALERRGRIKRSNNYQDLLNEIAIDIRQKHKRRQQRRKEAENVRATLAALDEKMAWLDEKHSAYNDTFEQSLNTLQKKGKKRHLMPFSKQWIHQQELKKQGNAPRYGSFKYSAQNLADKGVLISWRGYDMRDVDLTIASDEVNKFTLVGSNGTIMMPSAVAEFNWDELLEAQYQGQRELRYFGVEGSNSELVLDTKAFMHQVSKKFWPEG